MCAPLARDLSRCASHRSSSRHDASARLLMGKVHTPLDGSLWHGLAIDSASSNLTWQGLQSAPSMAVSRWSTSTCPRRSKRRSAWHNMRVRWPSCASSRCLRTRYAFRCHREKKDGLEHVYPVNALAFNPVYVGAAWRCGLYFLSHGCNPCTAMARLPLEAVMAVSARGTASTASDWPTFRDSRLGSCTLLRAAPLRWRSPMRPATQYCCLSFQQGRHRACDCCVVHLRKGRTRRAGARHRHHSHRGCEGGAPKGEEVEGSQEVACSCCAAAAVVLQQRINQSMLVAQRSAAGACTHGTTGAAARARLAVNNGDVILQT